MKSEGSLPYSQQPYTCPYPEPDQSSSWPHPLKVHFNIFLPSTLGSSKWSISLRFPHQNPLCTSTLPHTYYMTFQSHPSPFDHPSNVWLVVQVTKLLIMYASPLPRFLVPSMPKYAPQHPILICL